MKLCSVAVHDLSSAVAGVGAYWLLSHAYPLDCCSTQAAASLEMHTTAACVLGAAHKSPVLHPAAVESDSRSSSCTQHSAYALTMQLLSASVCCCVGPCLQGGAGARQRHTAAEAPVCGECAPGATGSSTAAASSQHPSHQCSKQQQQQPGWCQWHAKQGRWCRAEAAPWHTNGCAAGQRHDAQQQQPPAACPWLNVCGAGGSTQSS